MRSRLLTGLVAAAFACGQALVAADTGPPLAPGNEFDDPITPLAPKRPRTEAESDHLHALALFAAGRMAEQKQELSAALRMYERALRFDPEALPILREIVPLAFNLDRHAEAVRYALLAANKEASDQVLLRRLGIYLTDEGNWEQALKLYEKADALAKAEKPKASSVSLWMEMGRLYYLTKKHEPAAARFSKVLGALEHPADYGIDEALRKALLGNGELTYQLIGESFLEVGKTDEAQAAFEKANSLKPDEGLLASNLARIEFKLGRFDQALAKLQVYLDKHLAVQGMAPYELLAETLDRLGKKSELNERLEKAQAGDPDNVPLAYYLARQYASAEKFDKSEALLQGLLKSQGKRPPIEAYRALLDIGRRSRNAEKLLDVLSAAVERSPTLAPLGDEGKALLADGELTTSILAIGKKRLDAGSAGGDKLIYGQGVALGLLALEAKQFDTAKQFFDEAIQVEPKKAGELLLTWGMDLILANQYAAAAGVFQRGIDSAALPADSPAFDFYLAGALEMSGRTDAALQAARKAAEKQQDSARFAGRAPWIEYHAKRFADARRDYLEMIKKFDPMHEPAEIRDALHDARLAMSNLEVQEKNMPAAEEWLEQVLDEFPDDPGALNDLGYLWAEQGKNLGRALTMLQKAVAAEPENKAYRDSLGWAFYRLGRHAEAVTELKLAADVKEPDGVVLDHWGDALLKAGDAKQAVEVWERSLKALEKESDPERTRQILAKIEQARRS